MRGCKICAGALCRTLLSGQSTFHQMSDGWNMVYHCSSSFHFSYTRNCLQPMGASKLCPLPRSSHIRWLISTEYKSSAPLPQCGTILKGHPSSTLPEGLTMAFQQLSHSSASFSALSAASFLYKRCSQGSSINVLHRNPLSVCFPVTQERGEQC